MNQFAIFKNEIADIIQSILGQSDFKTTMDRYVHARDNKKQEAIKNVSLLLQN